MKKMILFCSVFYSLLVLNSCSNEFDVIDEPKEIPIVWGFVLNTDSTGYFNDTAQYIRVERAFSSKTNGADVISQIPDSLYFSNAIVQLENVSKGINLTMQKVDGNLEGYVRKDGIFAKAPNYLYKVKSSDLNLDLNEQLRLTVKVQDGAKELVNVTTRATGPFVIRDVTGSGIIKFLPDKITNLQWSAHKKGSFIEQQDQAVGLYNITLFIDVLEQDLNDPGIQKLVRLTWPIEKGFQPNASTGSTVLTYKLPSNSFYAFLKDALDKSVSAKRTIENIDIRIDSGGKEFVEAKIASDAGLGLTSSEYFKSYSNIPGGAGVFTTRSYNIGRGFRLDPQTEEELKIHPNTKDLGF